MGKSAWRGLALALVVVVSLTACGKDKPPAKKADELRQRALNAQVAGDNEEALKLYEDVLEVDPNNKFAHYNIGLIKQTAGDKAEAERRYRLTLAADPNYGPALFNLAILRYEAGSNQEAVDLYNRVIAIDPRNPNAHLNLGFALKALGRNAEAERSFATAVRLDPKLRERIPATKVSPSPASPTASASS